MRGLEKNYNEMGEKKKKRNIATSTPKRPKGRFGENPSITVKRRALLVSSNLCFMINSERCLLVSSLFTQVPLSPVCMCRVQLPRARLELIANFGRQGSVLSPILYCTTTTTQPCTLLYGTKTVCYCTFLYPTILYSCSTL